MLVGLIRSVMPDRMYGSESKTGIVFSLFNQARALALFLMATDCQLDADPGRAGAGASARLKVEMAIIVVLKLIGGIPL